jgi:hypothetical protein
MHPSLGSAITTVILTSFAACRALDPVCLSHSIDLVECKSGSLCIHGRITETLFIRASFCKIKQSLFWEGGYPLLSVVLAKDPLALVV